MMEAAILLVGIIIGYTLCMIAKGSSKPAQTRKDTGEQEESVLVRRSKVSLRSPLQTNRTQYDKYKVRDTGLYSSVSAKGEPVRKRKDEIEIGG